MKSSRILAALLLLPAALLGGANRWTTSGPDAGAVKRIYTVPEDPNEAFALTAAGIYKTTDGGQSWRPASRGLPNSPIQNFVAVTDRALYLSIADRVFASDDGGEHWYLRGSLGALNITALAFDPISRGDAAWLPSHAGLPGANASDVDIATSDPLTAYAATDAGVFRTDDGGNHWIAVNAAPNAKRVAISPATGDTAYISLSSGSLQRTSDRGATWTQVTPNFASVLAIAPSDPKTLYAVFANNMEKSADGGDTWHSIDNGLFLGYYGFFAESIAIDRSSASDVVLATHDLIAQTTTAGASWSVVNWDETDVAGITIDSADRSTLFGGRRTTGCIRSSDSGVTWKTVGLSNKHVTTLVMRGASLYAGTDDGHIYRSDDRGNSWIGFDQGTSLGSVKRLAADSSGKHFLAATAAGVYRYDVPDQIITPASIDEDSLRLPEIVDAIAGSPRQNAALVVPIVGTVEGAGGTKFSTELMLSNASPNAQTVRITWLPRGFDGDVASFALTVPGASDPGGGTVDFLDIGQAFSRAGLGSLIIRAVDASGNIDTNASIDASTIVWSDFGDGRAPASQSIPAARANQLASHHVAVLAGPREDAQFRTNTGIVNLTALPHQFTVQINGERSSAQFTINVPPLSVVQAPLPDADYGVLFLNVIADSSDARWLLYGSSIDRTTGEAEASLASSYE